MGDPTQFLLNAFNPERLPRQNQTRYGYPVEDSNRNFLMWIHARLEEVHGENHSMDYMHKLRAIIAEMPDDLKTFSVGQGRHSLGALREMLISVSSPTDEGDYYMSCLENENEPELVLVYRKNGILRASLTSIGDYDLRSLHYGLTAVKWSSLVHPLKVEESTPDK